VGGRKKGVQMTAEPLPGLTSCDREPIHIPGSIQPHGVLLVVSRQDLAVLQFAGDTRFLVGVEARRLPQLTLFSLFEQHVLLPIVEHLRTPTQTVVPCIFLGINSRAGLLPLDATVHANGKIAIVELEPARRSKGTTGDPLSQVKSMLAALHSAKGFEAYCRAVAVQVRAITGFDRVMVYQFQYDGSGEVVAEDRTNAVESFLGLRYPASDIPAQARELYRRNWLRLIPDVAYMPAPLEAAVTASIGGPPLDMSNCTLRNVSPIHREYLHNMEVRASMSISIVIRDELWGLIACHHSAPRYVAADLRIACELFAQIFSLHLDAKIEADASQRRFAARRVLETLAARVPLASDITTGLMTGEVTLVNLIPAGGVATWIDGKLHVAGATPPPDFIMKLVAWLNGLAKPILETYQLGTLFPPARAHSATASGLLAVSLPRQITDYVMWFRPEVARTVTWAGNPEKMVGDRLTPRTSFEAWQEEVREQSVPWDEVDCETARALRVSLLETVLRQVDLARRERDAAISYQDRLMAELDHRVKNILASIQAMVRQTGKGASSLEDFTQALEQRIRAMADTHGLLAANHWHGARLRSMVEDELAPYRAANGGNVQLSGDDIMLSPKAALPFTLVLHELASNAAKYGSLSTPAGCVRVSWRLDPGDGALVVTWKELRGPPVAPPARRGFGSVIIERSLRYELAGECTLTFAADGVGCIISLPSEYVADENGLTDHD